MKQNYKNIIFDWSGVINDNQLTTHITVNKVIKYFGGPEVPYEEFRREWEQPFMIFYHKYLPDLSLEDEIKAYKKIYPEVIKDYPPKPYLGIVEIVNNCNKSKDLFIVSSDYQDYLLKEIEDFGFKNYFKEIVAGVHDKEEGLKMIVQKYNLELDQTIFIGDTAHEIEVGKIAGIKTAGVTWGIQSEERLLKAQPDHLIHNLEELKAILQ